ncbi:MAG: M48 family metalloprotease [Acidobacteria bacterium]|nr:M48 family metalloprotease [Acidobacteriota bacterium]
MNHYKNFNRIISGVILFTMLAMPFAGLAQTHVIAPKNPYKAEDDIKLGRQAAAEAEKQFPILNDREVTDYVERVGDRLVEAIPREYQHPEFRFSYKVVNVSDLNAFALPGGFTYVNRGLIEAAKNEGELAGVMAHELSHVALRHGTAQYAKAQKLGIWAGIAAIGGAVLGGQAGAAAAQGLFGVYFMKYSREYERQADTLGAQIMARAGYDPRDLANMFRTLEQQGGKSGPEWLSDHPNPGNRYEAINREASMLPVSNRLRDDRDFNHIRAVLRDMPRARTTQEVGRGGNTRQPTRRTGSRSGEPPSRAMESYRSPNGNYRVNFPANWQTFESQDGGVTFAPDWAIEGNDITRGVIVGAFTPKRQRGYITLDKALNTLINDLSQTNAYLQEDQSGRYRESLAGREALATMLYGQNPSGYNERVWVVARPNGNEVVYMVFIAPENDFRQYQPTFAAMLRSYSLSNNFR